MATYADLNLLYSASPLMEQLTYFHDHTMFIIIMILMLVGYMMIHLMINKFPDRFTMDGQFLEIIWTILPVIIFIFIALPSLRILYLIDETSNPNLTLKTIEHQWYWSYEYSDMQEMEFDSYMIPQNELSEYNIRLMEVDKRTIIPMNTLTWMLITSEEVLHSWTIPSIGIKADATPGRMNQVTFWLNHPGVFYGLCSEICGANHGFMPITIESTSINDFINWMKFIN